MGKNCLALIVLCLLISFFVHNGICGDAKTVAWWTFDGQIVESVHEKVRGIDDPLFGNFRVVEGVSGQALKFDGYTTVVTRITSEAPALSSAFTIEAWLAIAAYPWGWCPIVCNTDNRAGYALEIGPGGELAMKIFSGSAWRTCISNEKISLYSTFNFWQYFVDAKNRLLPGQI